MSKTEFISLNDESLSIIQCTDSSFRARDFCCGPNIYKCYYIECCTSGFFHLEINGKEFYVKEGDCYVLFPGDRITHKTNSKSARSELTCSVRGLELKKVMKQAGITSESPFARPSAYKEICASIKRILEFGNNQSMKADYLRTAELYKIMASLIDDKSKIETTSIIQKATDIIDNEYMNDLSVENIANQIGLERCYFSVLFKKHTGQTPHAYLNSVRIKKACALISSTDLPISEIAIQVGLEPSGFARMFKREMKVTPGIFKKQSTAPLT